MEHIPQKLESRDVSTHRTLKYFPFLAACLLLAFLVVKLPSGLAVLSTVGAVIVILLLVEIGSNPPSFLKFIAIWLPLQSFVIMLFVKFLDLPDSVSFKFFLVKEFFLFFCVFTLLIKGYIKGLIVHDKLALIVIALCLFYLLEPFGLVPVKVPFNGKLVGFRAIALPFMVYFVGRFIRVGGVTWNR